MDFHFFNRRADIVARELLGKLIIRNVNGNEKRAIIVETEAYFDETDPASRACFNGDLKETMKMKAGTILVYGVHNNWLVNIVTDNEGVASAVLIRAIEPLNFHERCNGPGLLTRALLIDKTFHKKNIFDNRELWIEFSGKKKYFNDKTKKDKGKSPIDENRQAREPLHSQTKELLITNKKNNFEIIEGFRIGVKKDLPEKMRFFIKGIGG